MVRKRTDKLLQSAQDTDRFGVKNIYSRLEIGTHKMQCIPIGYLYYTIE